MTETLGAMLTVAGAFALTALIMATGIGMAWLADLVNCEITRRSRRCNIALPSRFYILLLRIRCKA